MLASAIPVEDTQLSGGDANAHLRLRLIRQVAGHEFGERSGLCPMALTL